MNQNAAPQEVLFHYLEEPFEKGANLFLLPIEQWVDHVADVFTVL